MLIASQRDRWQTVPEVLHAWHAEARKFQMREADPRQRSISIAFQLAIDRVFWDTGCLELMTCLALVPDYLTVSVMDLVLETYPSLNSDEVDPLGALIRHGLIEATARHIHDQMRTTYYMLNPLKTQTLDMVDDSIRVRAVQRLSKAYEEVLHSARQEGASISDASEPLARATVYQAWSLLTTEGDTDATASERLIHAMRDHARYLPQSLRFGLRQLASHTVVVNGGTHLSGAVEATFSGRVCIPLVFAAALNRGVSKFMGVRRTPKVDGFVRLLEPLGVRFDWSGDGSEVVVSRVGELDMSSLDTDQARASAFGALLPALFVNAYESLDFPISARDDDESINAAHLARLLGTLRDSPASYLVSEGCMHFEASPAAVRESGHRIVLTCSHALCACAAIVAASQIPSSTVLINVPWTHLTGEVCAYLQLIGVEFSGLGTYRLTVQGASQLEADVIYRSTEDPLDALVLVCAATVTRSRLVIRRVPVEYLGVELELLHSMGICLEISPEYPAMNGWARLADVTVRGALAPAPILRAPEDKIHPDPMGASHLSRCRYSWWLHATPMANPGFKTGCTSWAG